jgi:hypothetical protein
MIFLDFLKKFTKKKVTKKIQSRPLTDDEFNEIRSKRQKKMNDILDKISKKGIESLSIHEKNFLDNYGKN